MTTIYPGLGFSFAPLVFSFIFLFSYLGLAWELHERSRERDGCLGDKLDHVWITSILYRRFGVVHISSLCISHFSFLVIFGAFSLEIRGEDLREFSLRFWCGIHTWVPRDSFLGDPPFQIRGKILRFGGFWMNSWRGVLEVWLSIALDLVSFGAWSLSHGMPMRYS